MPPMDLLSGRNRALLSLAGLSVGDALGEGFFGVPEEAIGRIEDKVLPSPPWRYTDDTEMALSIVEVLLDKDALDPDLLARCFARRYDSSRGYGAGAHRLLQAYGQGAAWQQAAPQMFGGAGSFGNGAAMRVAPLGGYFAPDLDNVVEHAMLSAVVTHAHPEGVAGAVAVAVAAAMAWQQAEAEDLSPGLLFKAVINRTPAGMTHDGIKRASSIAADTPVIQVARQLGSGQNISSKDTVPFVIWCAAHNLSSYEQAFWTTVAGLGDRDTTCAMVGGIVALSARQIPETWLRSREPLPDEFLLEALEAGAPRGSSS